MPLYEFQCQECDTRFELMVKMADAQKLPTCPACNSSATRKLISTIFDTHAVSPDKSSTGGSCGSSGRFT
jgi:putative FmdB family regulatory protein